MFSRAFRNGDAGAEGAREHAALILPRQRTREPKSREGPVLGLPIQRIRVDAVLVAGKQLDCAPRTVQPDTGLDETARLRAATGHRAIDTKHVDRSVHE